MGNKGTMFFLEEAVLIIRLGSNPNTLGRHTSEQALCFSLPGPVNDWVICYRGQFAVQWLNPSPLSPTAHHPATQHASLAALDP